MHIYYIGVCCPANFQICLPDVSFLSNKTFVQVTTMYTINFNPQSWGLNTEIIQSYRQ